MYIIIVIFYLHQSLWYTFDYRADVGVWFPGH